jgi:hypothetical protein
MTDFNGKFDVGNIVLILESKDGAEHEVGSVGLIVDLEEFVSSDDAVEFLYLVDVGGEEWWHKGECLGQYVGQSVKTLLVALKEIQEFGSKNCGFGYSCSEIARKALNGWS